MKRLIPYFFILPLVISFYIRNTIADTIPDSTQIYGKWDIDGSPYIVMGLGIIPMDSTLAIESGVQVQFKSSTNDSAFIIQYLDIGWLKVHGKIVAEGTESNPIVFSSEAEGKWGGINFTDASQESYFKYCSVEGCKRIYDELYPGESYQGGLTFENSKAKIHHSDFKNNDIGVFIQNSEVDLMQNEIEMNANGICFLESTGIISASKLRNNYDYGIHTNSSSVTIENNLIEGQLTGIICYESFDTILGNKVQNNLWGGIEITRCNPFIFRNVICGSNSGIRCSGSPRIINNTIVNNNYFGIYCDWNAKPVIVNNIIYGNNSLVNYNADDTLTFVNCLLEIDSLSNNLIDAGGNILNEDPMFVDPGNEDFSLGVESPCINTGTPYFEWKGEIILNLNPNQYTGIAPDIGAIESAFVGIPDSHPDRQKPYTIIAFPNPSNENEIKIYSENAETIVGQLLVLDQMGCLIHKQKMPFRETLIDVTDWPPAVYLAIIHENGIIIGQTKVIIQ